MWIRYRRPVVVPEPGKRAPPRAGLFRWIDSRRERESSRPACPCRASSADRSPGAGAGYYPGVCGGQREDGRETEDRQAPAARGHPPPQCRRRDACRYRPQLQRQPGDDFTARRIYPKRVEAQVLEQFGVLLLIFITAILLITFITDSISSRVLRRVGPGVFASLIGVFVGFSITFA